MTERSRINSINYARQEGEQKGLRKGLKEGERKGKAESQREIALAFKAKGVDAGMIADCTGLSLDEVDKL